MVLRSSKYFIYLFVIFEIVFVICTFFDFVMLLMSVLMGCLTIYRWEQLRTKQLENYEGGGNGRHSLYVAGAIFSPYKVYKPKRLEPMTYSYFVPNPFSFVFIYLLPKMDGPERIPPLYEVEEKLFLEKMEEWGVELTGSTGREIK